MYSIKCIASERESDRVLEDMTVFRIDTNKYRIEPYKFKMYTSLSKALVYARFHVASWKEYTSDLHTEWMDLLDKREMPCVFVILNAPNDWTQQHVQLMAFYDSAKKRNVPFVYRREDEREVRDEMYFQIFSYLLREIHLKHSLV